MSSEIIKIEGIEIRDGLFNFSQLFRRLYNCGDAEKHKLTIEMAAGVAWGKIRDKYKDVEQVTDMDGKQILRRWISEPGVYQLASTYDSPVFDPFKDLLFEKILPQLRKTGVATIKTSGDALVDNAQLLKILVNQHCDLVNQAFENRKIAEEADKNAREADEKAEKALSAVHALSGHGLDMYTVRFWMLENGLNPEADFRESKMAQKQALGSWCRSEAIRRNVRLPPKVAEGTYHVNQYPSWLIEEGAKNLRLH